ncbi:MAG: glycoside hydrolase family 3 N-terminal domain-containing protein [Mobilicoccus sp.]|nr:glycoside hydrolase family 3 N-terminal domain-containing protein [Mobilicoccus sp.]
MSRAGIALASALLVGCAATQGAGVAPPTTASVAPTSAATPTATPTQSVGEKAKADTAREMRTARAEVSRLSTRALAAQVVVPDLGTVSAGEAGVRGGYGGVVVMRSSLPQGAGAAKAAKAANDRYRAAMRRSGRAWPAFIAVDQEGGPVTRVDDTLTAFPAAMALGATRSADLAAQVGRASGAELAGLGFTVVMSPVADVTSPQDPTIGVRSPGGEPGLVTSVAGGYVDGYREAGLVSVIKHFPGHGAVAADTHHGAARLTATRQQLNRRDLVPFQRLSDAGAPAVMTAHVTVEAVDKTRPASLSKPVTTTMLRRELGFSGLVVTDALNMGAVTQGTAPGEATVRAIEAGADVALMPADPAAAVRALERAVTSGRISRARLEESAARMVATLRVAERGRTVAPTAPGAHQKVARAAADASITQIGGRCGERLVGSAVTVTGGTDADRAQFTRAAKAAGLRIGGQGATRVALLGGRGYQAGGGQASGTRTASGDVLVALDVPYGLAEGSAKARLAVYGRTPATFDALAAVLTGRQAAKGALPVTVGEWKAGTRCG